MTSTDSVTHDGASNKLVTPQFLLDFQPAVEKTELLFHISYLCLGKFPQLERIIRANAVEAQMVFNSSEALLLQCVGTSYNMVKILFPLLVRAVTMENAAVAIKFLEKAEAWIDDIIRELLETVNEYEKLSRGVESASNDVLNVKNETDHLTDTQSSELNKLKKSAQVIEARLKTTQAKLNQNQRQHDEAERTFRALLDEIKIRDQVFGFFAAVVPEYFMVLDEIQKAISGPKDRVKIGKVMSQMSQLQRERELLTKEVGKVETDLMNAQFKVTMAAIQLGSIPDPVHLPDVQANLVRIRKILLDLRDFWAKVAVQVVHLEQKTFAEAELVELLHLPEIQKLFLDSIKKAEVAWTSFRIGCSDVVGIFNAKNKDAYKFLEINPSTLSPEEWQKQYKALQVKLDSFDHATAAIEAKPREATSQ